jgi:hypothetical protein
MDVPNYRAANKLLTDRMLENAIGRMRDHADRDSWHSQNSVWSGRNYSECSMRAQSSLVFASSNPRLMMVPWGA